MEWHLNDLSLAGQFSDPQAFRAALEPILRLRRLRDDLRRRIYCSRSLYLRPVTDRFNLQESVFATGDRLFKRLALEWFANGGPFWDDERMANPNDYFEFAGQDVTDQGLGEAARRCLDLIPAGVLSFPHGDFARTPLSIQHGLAEEPLGHLEIANFWRAADIEAAPAERAGSWEELMSTARARLDLLVFGDEIAEQLRPCPFHAGIAERIFQLLQVLQSLATETDTAGAWTEKGAQIHQTYFTGKAAAFTDESEPNKAAFKTELTFRDPTNPAARLFCPWHGKVKHGQFRIHFEWKRPSGQRQIKVLYIGPKITKH